MKKAICVMLAISVFMCGSISAFAVTKESNTIGVVKFQEYLSTLNPERAAIIRSDPELIRVMTQDQYWKKATRPMSYTAVSLPLSEYGVGSFFTTTGKACTCHNYCDYVAGQSTCGYSGKSGTCKVHNGAIQCFGFANYVFFKYSGVNTAEENEIPEDVIPGEFAKNSLGYQELSSFMRGWPTGTSLRMRSRVGNYSHSFIILSTTRTGATIYDCNSDGVSCQVAVKTLTWEQLVEKYKYVVKGWYPGWT